MITTRLINWFLAAALMLGSVAAVILAIYFGELEIFIGWWFFSAFIYVAAFIMELFHVDIADLILRVVDRFHAHGSSRGAGK